ncbi:hypothetical protein PLICRDRAFT_184571 [Plicaturopsis crispa FD-325 SS-3]|nr:hypothetical protein PLICRDRAFT_184571 [Plicaturopsis crispa FD-325 SS-3]
MDDQSVNPKATVSRMFDLPDSNLTIRSCNNVLFRVHRINLEMHSEAFAGAMGFPATASEEVSLPETSAVLELLLQYMYLRRQPNLRDVKFEVLEGLAEAAEKYQVYAAMEVCGMMMRHHIPHHALSVLRFATRHDYRDIADEAAARTVSLPIPSVMAILPLHWFTAWVHLHHSWAEILRYASTTCPEAIPWHLPDSTVLGSPDGFNYECRRWTRIFPIIISSLFEVGAATDIENVFLPPPSLSLLSDQEEWFYQYALETRPDRDPPVPEFLAERCLKCDAQLGRWKKDVVRKCTELKRLSNFL